MKNGYFEFPAHFAGLTDPREDRGLNHQLLEIVGLALCGTICGANSRADIERFAKGHIEWFERFLKLPFGVPSHDTFSRVFTCLDTAEFQECPGKWVEQLQLQLEGETVAIDGKTLRGSRDRAEGNSPLHVINAWARQVNFCLGQINRPRTSCSMALPDDCMSVSCLFSVLAPCAGDHTAQDQMASVTLIRCQRSDSCGRHHLYLCP